MQRRSIRVRFLCAAASLCLPFSAARAAEFALTVSGPFASATNQAFTFDGTNSDSDNLPPLFNIAALTGGTFSATYIFSPPTPAASGTSAGYSLPATTSVTYDLFDASGHLLNHGGNASDAGAIVFNDQVFSNGPSDFINLYAFVNDVSNLALPSPLYSPAGDVFATQTALLFGGDVTPGTDFLSDLSIPIDAQTCLAFPRKSFVTGMIFGDGDYLDFTDPYQYVETDLVYAITSVSVTAVPEPSAAAWLAMAATALTPRNRRTHTSLSNK